MYRSFFLVLLVLLLIAGGLPSATQDEPAEQDEPLDLGLTERADISLMFIDVIAVDAAGRPMPGLKKEDFRLKLDYVPREIYSVDDLCPCSAQGEPLAAAPVESEVTADLAPIREQKPPLFVLYFDFSQLQQNGRAQALQEGRRWIEQAMQPDDRAMLVGYTGKAGVRRLTDFTSDRKELLAALEAADQDPELYDEFPSRLGLRMRRCRDGDVSCYYSAKKDYAQSQRSYRALLNFVTELDDWPERKALIFFHQNNTIFPGRLYSLSGQGQARAVADELNSVVGDGPGPRYYGDGVYGVIGTGLDGLMLDGTSTELVPDLVRLANRVGGTATATRTEIYPAVCGFGQTWTVNLGANMADFTGGDYNRGPIDLSSMLDGAGRGCKCIYRIAVEAPERDRSKVYYVRVKADGYRLRGTSRLQFISPLDRWMRRAQSVLLNPESATDVGVIASLEPIKPRGGKQQWDLRVQVSLDLNQLLVLPEGARKEGEWEVGALLADGRGKKTWEMLGISRLRIDPDQDDRLDDEDDRDDVSEDDDDVEDGAFVLHERTISGLRPGSYELRAFVRDRGANLYGGAETVIELPRVGEATLIGPTALRPRMRHLLTTLPLRKKKNERPPVQARLRKATLPRGADPVEAGKRIEFRTLICPGRPRDIRDMLERVVEDAHGAVVLVPDDEKLIREGDCAALTERVPTRGLEPGIYTYRVAWDAGPESGPLASEVRFEVAEPESGPPADG